MFKKQIISLILSWSILVVICFWIFQIPSSKAQLAYQHLMTLGDQVKKKHAQEATHLPQQTRYQVSKQIFFKQDFHRLQSRLTSEQSELFFNNYECQTELVEHFKKLACAMQERFIHDSESKDEKNSVLQQPLTMSEQSVRFLQAKEAVYSYKTHLLKAEKVDIAYYLIPGTSWHFSLESFQPLLQGHAKTLQLSLLKEPNLNAQGFQATFHDWEKE